MDTLWWGSWLAILSYLHNSSENKKLSDKGNSADPAFISRSYYNWKDATGEKGALKIHTNSNFHKRATELIIDLPSMTKDIGELLFSAHAQEKQETELINWWKSFNV